jgi:hypothetical protein
MDLFATLLRRQATLLIDVLHVLDKLLPARLLYWFLYPYGMFRGWRDPVPFTRTLPIVESSAPDAPSLHASAVIHIIRLLEFLPDRLTAPRWKKRCRINGLERLLEAYRKGPVVLAFAHIGPLTLTSLWLRARGIRATSVRDAAAGRPSPAKQYANTLMAFPEVPSVVYHDELRPITQLLNAGGVILIAIDSPIGKQVDVPVDDHWVFRMATGAMRLAAHHGAELIPCTILYEGNWQFRIELGDPVPREFLSGRVDQPAVGKHLYAQLAPYWLAYTDQCLKMIPRRYCPISVAAACDPPS